MARKRFTILYPDHSKDTIGVTERDQLLLAERIVHVAGTSYRYLGQVQTMHAMSEMECLQARFGPKPIFLHYLGGSFIWEFDGKRHRERLETPEGMAARMSQA